MGQPGAHQKTEKAGRGQACEEESTPGGVGSHRGAPCHPADQPGSREGANTASCSPSIYNCLSEGFSYEKINTLERCATPQCWGFTAVQSSLRRCLWLLVLESCDSSPILAGVPCGGCWWRVRQPVRFCILDG